MKKTSKKTIDKRIHDERRREVVKRLKTGLAGEQFLELQESLSRTIQQDPTENIGFPCFELLLPPPFSVSQRPHGLSRTLLHLFRTVQRHGCSAFLDERDMILPDNDDDPVIRRCEFTVVPTSNQFDLLHLMNVHTPNCAIYRTAEELIPMLRNIHRSSPLMITGLSRRSVKGIFLEPLVDAEKTLLQLKKFEDDSYFYALVDDTEAAVKAVRSLKKHRRFNLGWGA